MQNNDIQFYCDNRSIVVSNFLTEQECNKLDNFMRTFNYEGLQEYPSEYFNKRQISKKQMSTQPGFEDVMDPIELGWIGKKGGWNYYNFIKTNQNSIDIQRTEYKKWKKTSISFRYL